jgi:hypothetical protein
MPGHAKSQEAKHLAALHAICENEDRAVMTYNCEMEVYFEQGGPKPSFRGVTKRFHLDPQLLKCWQENIGLSKQAPNACHSHLSDTSALALIDFTIVMAHCGFPLNLKDLEAHGLEIAQHCWPGLKKFSHNWAQRFMTKYGSHVSMKWVVLLDTICGKSVSPTICKHYFDLLEKMLKEHNILPHNIYGFDESGFPLGGSSKTCVIAPTSSKMAKWQWNGNKEMVMVMVCICVDSSNVLPVVIFSDQNFLEKWKQNNPINAA